MGIGGIGIAHRQLADYRARRILQDRVAMEGDRGRGRTGVGGRRWHDGNLALVEKFAARLDKPNRRLKLE